MWVAKNGWLVPDEEMVCFKKFRVLYKKMKNNDIRLAQNLYRMNQAPDIKTAKSIVGEFKRLLAMDIL